MQWLLRSLRAARMEYRGQVYEVEVEEERYVFVIVCVVEDRNRR